MLRSKKGFTLIELMIVMAIIGILVAIFIPNFQAYRAKQRAEKSQIEFQQNQSQGKADQAKGIDNRL